MMKTFLESYPYFTLWLFLLSVFLLLLAIILLPLIVASLPSDYFQYKRRPKQTNNIFYRLVVGLLKNTLAVILIFAGIAMLVLPGQGLLTLLVGLLLLDYPGKYTLEKRLIRYSWVLRSLNWLRRKRGKKHFTLD